MEELENFRKRIDSIISRAYEGGVTILPFLDEAQQGILEEELKWHSNINYKFYGKIINADRKRSIISPYEIKNDDFKIQIFEIIYNTKYYELYHRSILGALMSLGIKRESIGDIVIKDKKAYFAATKEISKFLIEEFKSVGKAPIELKEIDTEIENEIIYETKTHFLSSLRIDCVVAGAYNLSRSEVLEFIERGDIFINHVLNLNPSHICHLDDLISIRHKGRVKISKIGGNTKSGRIAVDLSKRV